MVDQESRSYRPRRAFIEPEADPTPPPTPDPAPAPATTPLRSELRRRGPPKPLYATSTCRYALPFRPTATGRGAPPPAVHGGSAHPPALPPPRADDVGSDDTAIRSFTFARDPRTAMRRQRSDPLGVDRPRPPDRSPSGPDDIDDY